MVRKTNCWSFSMLRDFATVLVLMFKGASWSFLFMIAVFIISAGNEVIVYRSGKLIGNFYRTLLTYDEPGFWKTFLQASFLYLGQTLMIATFTFLAWILSYMLRKNLVKQLHNIYYNGKAYYHMCHDKNADIDNPDQRITQDADKLTTIFGQSIVPTILVAPAIITFYTIETWKTAGGISVACIYGYFVLGFVINRILGIKITRWTRAREQAEGDFRFKHMSVRDNAEESAFYDADTFELIESNRFLSALISVAKRGAIWKYPAQWFQLFFDYYGGVLTYLIQVIPIFVLHSYKDMEPGKFAQQISNNAFVFIYLINCFTRLTDLAMNIGEMAGYTIRIAEFVCFCRHTAGDSLQCYDNSCSEKDKLFTLQNVNILHPTENKKINANDLTLNFNSQDSVLITGASGSGKTSLLRILKGLWAPSAGDIQFSRDSHDVMFLPQTCYLPTGGLSLIEQLMFPKHLSTTEKVPEVHIVRNILCQLKLEHLISLCGDFNDPADFEWKDVLSPGEQQRLSIARALIRKPKMLVMDEATSSVGEDMEKIIYALLKTENIKYISTGHRQSLYRYHDFKLSLSGKEWKMSKIEQTDL